MTRPKVALITGAAAGIGRAAALRLAKRGYRIIVADVQSQKGEATAEAISKLVPSGEAAFVKLDVSSEENWKEAIAFTVKRFGGLTTLVNNAGIGGPVFKIENQTLDAWNKLQSINTAGPMLGMKAASEALHKAGKGASVVNVSSVYAICGAFGEVPAYHASKGAISALTKCVAVDWASAGIRVNAVLPGWVETELVAPEGLAAMLARVPLGRHATADEIAKAIEFLATDDSSFMTGSDLLIDGGMMLA